MKIVEAGIKLISRLPLSVLYGISNVLCFVAYYILRYRRDVVEDNLRQSFPELSEKERLKIGKKFYQSLCDIVVENVKLMTMSKEMVLAHNHLADSEGVRALKAETGSVMIMTAHFANWEWTCNMVGLKFPEKKMQVIYLKLTNSLFNDIMYKVRIRFGNQPIRVEQAFRQIYSDKETPRLCCFAVDQCPMEHQIGWWGPFFHRETPWFTGPEKLCRKMNLKVYFFHIRRLRRGHYEVDFELITRNPAAEPEFFITERYSQILENAIRAQPETWLWSHRRWKRSPKSV